jgi:hypothetical protein
VNATKGKAYISITFELSRANMSSMQIRNNHEAMSLLAVVAGFFVAISNPAKKDCDIPIYNTGSIITIQWKILLVNIVKSSKIQVFLNQTERPSGQILID